jgi:hypothetical protein
MHGPDEIYGMSEGDLILGLITSLHYNTNVRYQWFSDGYLVFEGHNAPVCKISTPEDYYKGINLNK